MVKALLPDIAARIATTFPELEGRSIAVTEAEITRENIPTLPLCMLALLTENNTNADSTGNTNIQIREEFMAEFWLKPARYKNAAGTETPFWSFYDYDTFRDVLLTSLRSYRSPRNGSISYVKMEIEVTAFAVVLTFTFRHNFKWCPLDNDAEEVQAPVQIAASVCRPVTNVCPTAFEPQEDCEKCP